MTDYLQAATQAASFIDSQRLEKPGQWRRSVGSDRRDRSLYHGSAGILLLLLELYAATGNRDRLDQAIAAGEDIAQYLGNTDWLSVSVATGWPGYAFALGELGRVSGRADFLELARSCLDRLRAQATEFGAGIGWSEPMPFSDITGFTGIREIYDQSVGSAGAALVMLHAHRTGLHDQALCWAIATGERLLEVAEIDPDGLRWRLMSDMPFPFTTPNFAHGGAGVGYLMAEFYRATGDTRFLHAAREAARYVLSRAAPVGDGCLVCRTEEATDPIYYLGQCHGPAGTGRLFLALHDLTGEAHWLDHAKALVHGLEAMGAPEARSVGLWNNYGQCCGDAGIGEFALLMANRTGEARYLELAKRCADVILAASVLADDQRHWVQAEHRDRPDFVEAQTGYMQGTAGIASFLLHLATMLSGNPVKLALPDWPEMVRPGV